MGSGLGDSGGGVLGMDRGAGRGWVVRMTVWVSGEGGAGIARSTGRRRLRRRSVFVLVRESLAVEEMNGEWRPRLSILASWMLEGDFQRSVQVLEGWSYQWRREVLSAMSIWLVRLLMLRTEMASSRDDWAS